MNSTNKKHLKNKGLKKGNNIKEETKFIRD